MPRSFEDFPNLRVFDHPLIQQKLTEARDHRTPPAAFRRLLNEIAGLMTYGACRHLEVASVTVQTPLERTDGVRLARPVTLVPLLRAGIGMTDGILALIPDARVGHFGVYRDESTLEPVQYYAKFPPDIAGSHVLVVDPMLATGGSAIAAIRELKRRECHDVTLICLVVAPEGVRRMHEAHGDVVIFAASLDRQLNERGYILPGLGDAGDRIFGTH